MKQRFLALICLLLGGVMLLGTLASCKDRVQPDDPEDQTTTEESTKAPEQTYVPLDGDYASLISGAYDRLNDVQTYYTSASRDVYVIENQNMTLQYQLGGTTGKMVTSLANKQGAAYLQNTMDAYVKTTDGGTYYLSNSLTEGRANLFRLGYYYYDVRILEQNCISELEIRDEIELDLSEYDYYTDVSKPKVRGGVLSTKVTSNLDPNISYKVECSTEYNYLEITLKVEGLAVTRGDIYVLAGSQSELSEKQKLALNIQNDGEYHTYRVLLSNVQDYTGMLRTIRLDFMGESGDKIEISSVKLLKASSKNAPALHLDRTFHTYSDKMHQTLHFVASADTANIAELGMITEIAADTVQALVVKDKNGEHDTIEGVDWASAEYIGFDIKDAGVFGYILPLHEESGKITVTLADGKYVLVQSTCPENGTIWAPVNDTSNDFYMGHRLYTDESHDFSGFLHAAYCERNPLTAENIQIEANSSEQAAFAGYNPLQGVYTFTLPGTESFNYSYYDAPNEHLNVVFTVTGDDRNREFYVQTFADSTNIECAALLGANELMLPVNLEVCKNFKHEKEEPLFDRGDRQYSEVYFPMSVKAGEVQTLKVINLYQNWGRFPLKQLSSIQFFMPYYHLSTGVTESNCIAPYYVNGRNLHTLPDHRSASSPLWSELPGGHPQGNQPQHTNGGNHYFLQYTDASGKFNASENVQNVVNASGPTYAEVVMDYVSDDGKIAVSYTHLEMPQLDENRTYCTMEYKVLEDVSISDFAKDFSFYRVTGFGIYGQVGYLDENNQPKIVDANTQSAAKVYVLGDLAPYFDYFGLVSGNQNDYINLSMIIEDADITIGGEKCDANFVVVDQNNSLSLSLNLGEVTLKAGDTIKMNVILTPWGDQNSTNDDNVRAIRENSVLAPVVVTPGEGTSIVESEWMPLVKSENGKSAEFTVSGGQNNIALRAYGFSMLTAPKIYEKIGDEWVEVRVNSAATPDDAGNAHHYDGYAVFYDGDGTYSYSFVFTQKGGAPRTFRIVAEEAFAGWPNELPAPEQGNDEDQTQPGSGEQGTAEDPIAPGTEYNFVVDAKGLKAAMDATRVGLGKYSLEEDGAYVRAYGDGSAVESVFNVFSSNKAVTGQYVVIKYRLPAGSNAPYFDVFTSTTGGEATAQNFCQVMAPICDGAWHVMVVDATKFATNQGFPQGKDGTYAAKFMRFDIFNAPTDGYIDIAYVAMCDSLDKVAANVGEVGEYTLYQGPDAKTVIGLN
ncbi:MAG: hypothetical protein IJW70_10295 [Clostridia bacterium]|nr:hypothetical protein [Clostridia bacterium]